MAGTMDDTEELRDGGLILRLPCWSADSEGADLAQHLSEAERGLSPQWQIAIDGDLLQCTCTFKAHALHDIMMPYAVMKS